MKGIILAGGSGTRLNPLTKVASKQLLPIYNHPMIYYPLQTLVKGGIKDILVIVAPDREEDFIKFMGDGSGFGVNITIIVQPKPEGLAQAFVIGEEFIDKDSVAMILGDNIFEDDFSDEIKSFKSGGHVFAKKVHDPERFGVVKFDKDMRATEIVEKPKKWISDYCVTGLYIYDNRVIEVAKNLRPSERGELEITDVNNWFLEKGELTVGEVKGEWFDAGTFDSLLEANMLIAKKEGSVIFNA